MIGADTSVGKTSVAAFMYLEQERLGYRPGYISCEDGAPVLGPRFLSSLSGVSSARAFRGAYSKEDMTRLGAAVEAAEQRNGFVRFLVGGNEDQVCRAIRDLVVTNKCDVIYVDYAQTIGGTGSPHEQRRETVRRIASRTKAEACRLGVPLVMLSQIARQKDERAEPGKHSLKESGDLENMAELVFMLWRKSIDASDPFYHRICMRVAKSKFGGDGTLAEFTRDPVGRLIES